MDAEQKAPRAPAPAKDGAPLDPETGLPAYELVPPVSPLAQKPLAPLAPLRVTGPGRRERDYQDRIQRLETNLDNGQREVECMHLVERGTQRLLDRMEHDSDRTREELADQRKLERRLVLTLGALQRENELLRNQLAFPDQPLAPRLTTGDSPPARTPRRPTRETPSTSFLARLFRRHP
jgi:hypothetical protein